MEPIPRVLRQAEVSLALSWLAVTVGATTLLVVGLSRSTPRPIATILGAVLMTLAAFVGITAARLSVHLRGPGSDEAQVRRVLPWLMVPLAVAAVIFSAGWWRLFWLVVAVPYVLDFRRPSAPRDIPGA